MFKLSQKIGLLFVAIVVIILASSLLLNDIDNLLIRKGSPYAIIIGIVMVIFWKNITAISLKFTNPVKNKIIVFPTMLVILAYSWWASEGFASQSNSTTFVLGLVVLIFLQTFWEELIFRGILLNHYLKNDKGLIRSLLYSSFLFAITHFINLFSNPSIQSVINQVLFSIIMGLFMGSLYLLSRNIYLTGLAHTLVNYPSYANKFKNDTLLTPEMGQDLAARAPLWESILGTVFLLLYYSPFLIVALVFIKKIKLDLAKSPLTSFTEFAFRPFGPKR